MALQIDIHNHATFTPGQKKGIHCFYSDRSMQCPMELTSQVNTCIRYTV